MKHFQRPGMPINLCWPSTNLFLCLVPLEATAGVRKVSQLCFTSTCPQETPAADDWRMCRCLNTLKKLSKQRFCLVWLSRHHLFLLRFKVSVWRLCHIAFEKSIKWFYIISCNFIYSMFQSFRRVLTVHSFFFLSLLFATIFVKIFIK